MLQRIRHMVRKELIQVLRDPRMRAIVFLIPTVQTMVIGYAVTTDVQHVPTAVYDMDNSTASRELASRFFASGYFTRTRDIDSYEVARQLIDRGTVTVVLHFDHGFNEDLRAGRTARLQLLVDGTDSNTAGILLSYANTIAMDYSRQLLVDRIQRTRGAFRMPGQVDLELRAWFNENLESRNYFVPGVIALVVTLTTLLLTSMAVVREKEIGTIEQIMVTPITSLEFILGKTIPFALVGLIEAGITAAVGVWWFQVPVRGQLLVLLLATLLYLMTTLGIGLIISTVSSTQQQAMMSVFFFFFPAMLLSGFVFPVENMPVIVQWLTCLNPLRFFLVIIRGVFLKGVGVATLAPQLATLAAMGCITLSVAVRRFRKTT
jgi:ABC-2 type transport system permease protein